MKRVFAALFVGFAFLGGGRSFAFLPPMPTDTESKQITQFMQAEKKGDHSLDAEMIAALQQRPLPNAQVLLTAAHALARFGDMDGLSAIETAAQDKNIYPEVAVNLKVQAAYLQAENLASEMPEGQARAKVKVDTFLQLLNLTPQKVNRDVVASNKPQPYPSPPSPIGLVAMGELVDMIYHGNYKDYADLPSVQQIDFKQNGYTNMVMRLAPLSRKERIATLVKDLAADKNYDTDAELRLATDEGAAAGQEAVAQLGRMEQNRSSYTKANFHQLFVLISQTHPPEMKAVRTWYSADPDIKVAENAYGYLQP